LATGSTSNRFRTRDLLLAGVLRRILDRETETWTRMATRMPVTSLEGFASALGQLLEVQVGPDRVLAQARRTIFVEAAIHPVLREEIRQGRAELTSWMAPLLAEFGASDPATAVEHLLALMEGLIDHQLATGPTDLDAVSPIATMLRGLCPPG